MRSCPAFILQRPLFACAAAYGAGVLAGGMWTGFGWLLPAAGIVCGLAAAALERGVERMFLQVEAENPPALALYRRAGFATAWAYEYWQRA